MKAVYLAGYDTERMGGGWTFMRNFVLGMGGAVTSDLDKAEVYMVAGATLVGRDDVEQAKQNGKKIVFRIDNAVRDSRNRNTGMSRLYDYAQMADVVIYQSKWARDYLYPFTKVDGPVILNGTDLDLYKQTIKTPDTYMYSRFNRDETKNWEVARYWFSQLAAGKDKPKLYVVGNFSDELRAANFDFYMGENYQFIPSMDHASYLSLLCTVENFIYSYYNDACSNSLIEARAANCVIADPHHFLDTGGAREIMDCQDLSIKRMAKQYREVIEAIV